jgi:hypothetical protein
MFNPEYNSAFTSAVANLGQATISSYQDVAGIGTDGRTNEHLRAMFNNINRLNGVDGKLS